jgi:hypothetical protein
MTKTRASGLLQMWPGMVMVLLVAVTMITEAAAEATGVNPATLVR